MKMLVALCLISTLAILHATSNVQESAQSNSEHQLKRVNRDIQGDSSLALVKWFKSVREGQWFDSNQVKVFDDVGPTKFHLKDCLEDGKYFNISHGLKYYKDHLIEGQGLVTFEPDSACPRDLKIVSVQGHFIDGNPDGLAIINFDDGSFAKATFNHGSLDGLYVKYGCKFGPCDFFELEAWRQAKHLKEIAVYSRGYKVGLCYEFKDGGGLVFGDNDLTGANVGYIYPDMKTMIVGDFEKGQLKQGREAVLLGVQFSANGLLKPVYELKGQAVFRYSKANQTFIGLDPLLRDPLEEKLVYVAESSIANAGRGVFCKANVSRGTVVAFYNGVKLTDLESKVKLEDRRSGFRMDNDWAKKDEILNIPMAFRSLQDYNATLGHLVNHGVKPNAWFGMIDHPRFGKIRSIVTLQDLPAHSELLVDYGYLDQYAKSETSIQSIYHLMKWYMADPSDEEFHKKLKYHIKYMRKKVDDFKPYMGFLKTFANML